MKWDLNSVQRVLASGRGLAARRPNRVIEGRHFRSQPRTPGRGEGLEVEFYEQRPIQSITPTQWNLHRNPRWCSSESCWAGKGGWGAWEGSEAPPHTPLPVPSTVHLLHLAVPSCILSTERVIIFLSSGNFSSGWSNLWGALGIPEFVLNQQKCEYLEHPTWNRCLNWRKTWD